MPPEWGAGSGLLPPPENRVNLSTGRFAVADDGPSGADRPGLTGDLAGAEHRPGALMEQERGANLELPALGVQWGAQRAYDPAVVVYSAGDAPHAAVGAKVLHHPVLPGD